MCKKRKIGFLLLLALLFSFSGCSSEDVAGYRITTTIHQALRKWEKQKHGEVRSSFSKSRTVEKYIGQGNDSTVEYKRNSSAC